MNSFWVEEEGSYSDFYGSKAQAMGAAEGAIRQIGLKGANKLTPQGQGTDWILRAAKAEILRHAG